MNAISHCAQVNTSATNGNEEAEASAQISLQLLWRSSRSDFWTFPCHQDLVTFSSGHISPTQPCAAHESVTTIKRLSCQCYLFTIALLGRSRSLAFGRYCKSAIFVRHQAYRSAFKVHIPPIFKLRSILVQMSGGQSIDYHDFRISKLFHTTFLHTSIVDFWGLL